MADERPVVFVDTTATFPDVMMSRTRWMQLLSLSAKGHVRLVMSTVVLRETARHWEKTARATFSRAVKERNGLVELGLIGRAHARLPEVLIDPAAFYDERKSHLTKLGAEVWPVPRVDVSAVLERDLARRKPFAESGKGFRDTLIWRSLVEVAEEIPSSRLLFFVTNNNDFLHEGDLHPDLRDEITTGVNIVIARELDDLAETDVIKPLVMNLSTTEADLETFLLSRIEDIEALDDLRPTIGSLIRDALLNAVENLVGEDVEIGYGSGGYDFSALAIPGELESPTIGHVEADPESVDWDAYETYQEETLLVRATIDADVDVEGAVFKGDYYVMEDEVTLIDSDWAKHYVLASVTMPARLVFQVRVEAGAGLVEDVELEEAEALPPAAG